MLADLPKSAWLPKLAIGSFAILLLSGVLATTNAGAGAPVTTAVVRIEPATQNVLAGNSVIIEIRVDDLTFIPVEAQPGLGAYEFELHFDPLVLTFVSFTNGPFLGSTGRVVTCMDLEQGAGAIRFGCLTDGPPPPDPPTGSGLLATLKFSTSNPGVSQLSFSRAGLADTLGKKIPIQIFGGQVTVKGSISTPTSTPRPGRRCSGAATARCSPAPRTGSTRLSSCWAPNTG